MFASWRRLTFQRGVLGGEPRFLALGALVWGLHALRRATQRQTGVLWQGSVEPGEQLVVTYHPPRRRRR